MSTLKEALETVVPAIVTEPATEPVRPAATLLCPNRISFTRYPTCEPDVTDQVPSTPVAAAVDEVVALADGEVFERDNGGGAFFAMKWM